MSAKAEQRVRTIDIHAHWYPADWLRLFERDGADRRRQARPQRERLRTAHRAAHQCLHRRVRRSRPAARGDGPRWCRRPRAVAHHADGVLGLARTRRSPCRNRSTTRLPQRTSKHPARFVGLAMLPMQAPGTGAEGAGARGEAARHARHVSRDQRERQRARRQAVLERVRESRSARLAGLPPPGRHHRSRPHHALLLAQSARQSVRHRRGRGLADLRRRPRRFPAVWR